LIPRPGPVPTTAQASTLALGIALLAPGAIAQSEDGGDAMPAENGAYGADSDVSEAADGELTALEASVLNELESIGINNLTVDKLSSGQLAGILLTLTATDRQDKEEAVTTIAADTDYTPGSVDSETIAGNESVRDTVEAAITRAGWSADVSQLSDEQVAALYVELARDGDLVDGERIRDIFEEAETQ